MTSSLASRCVPTWSCFAVFVLCVIAGSGCKTLHGIEVPSCPMPNDKALSSVERMIRAEELGPHGNESLLLWIAQIERYCRSLDAYRVASGLSVRRIE